MNRMTGSDVLQIALYMGTVLGLSWPLGRYMARVFEGKITVWGRIA